MYANFSAGFYNALYEHFLASSTRSVVVVYDRFRVIQMRFIREHTNKGKKQEKLKENRVIRNRINVLPR